MYAGRVACCPLVSRIEYAPRALLSLEKNMGQTDGRTQTDALRLPLDEANVLTWAIITGPLTHSVGGQTSNGRWRLLLSPVVYRL